MSFIYCSPCTSASYVFMHDNDLEMLHKRHKYISLYFFLLYNLSTLPHFLCQLWLFFLWIATITLCSESNIFLIAVHLLSRDYQEGYFMKLSRPTQYLWKNTTTFPSSRCCQLPIFWEKPYGGCMMTPLWVAYTVRMSWKWVLFWV